MKENKNFNSNINKEKIVRKMNREVTNVKQDGPIEHEKSSTIPSMKKFTSIHALQLTATSV